VRRRETNGFDHLGIFAAATSETIDVLHRRLQTRPRDIAGQRYCDLRKRIAVLKQRLSSMALAFACSPAAELIAP